MSGYWDRKKVFVTGCTGLLGPWMTERLVQEGAELVALVRDRVSHSNFYLLGLDRKVSIVNGDVTDLALLERILNEYEIETVFHLAAQAIVVTANRSPVSTFESNIRGTWSILEASRRSPWVKRIVVASSDKAYGEHTELPYDEGMSLRPTNFYDVSKASAELISQAYFKSYRLPVAIARCGNLYGGGDLNFNRIVPGTIESTHRGVSTVIRSDGQYVRDYFYVMDAVEAYLSLAQHMDSPAGVVGQAFNFSNEEPITVLGMVERILKRMGREELKPEVLGNASGEIVKQYLSSRKSRETLGWKAAFSLDEGLDQTISWYRNFFAGRSRQ
ncbi:MAG: NAD-dependent epimerase/dehydratase family protein [Candidatus Binatia bacterium]